MPSSFARRIHFFSLQGACHFFLCKAHAFLHLQGTCLSSFARRIPSSAESLSFPFLNITLTHRGSAKRMAEHGVGLSPNVACEFKTGRLS